MAATLSRGLVVCYPFNEGAGAKVVDLARPFNYGVFTPTLNWIGLQDGPALNFNGTTDCVVTSTALTPVTFTHAAWVIKRTTTQQCVMGQGIASANDTSVLFRINGTSGFSTSPGVFVTIAVPDISLNVRHLVALSYDGATMSFYLDGALNTSAAKTGTPSVLANPFTIGRIGDFTSTQFWDGMIDSVMSWNRPLAPAEHFALFDPATRWDLYAVPRRLFTSATQTASLSRLALLGAG